MHKWRTLHLNAILMLWKSKRHRNVGKLDIYSQYVALILEKMIIMKCWKISGIAFIETHMGVYPKTRCRTGCFETRPEKPQRLSPAARPAPQWPLSSWTSRCPLPSEAKPGFGVNQWVDSRENLNRKDRKPWFFQNREISWRIVFQPISATQKKRKNIQGYGRSSTRLGGFTNKHSRSDAIDLT